MKRELKFRAWDSKDEKMFIPDYITNEGLIMCHNEYECPSFHPNDTNEHPLILMQYTGLKDKNGKEIYEGDITNYGIIKWFNELCWDGSGSCHPGFYFKNGGIHQENDENYIDMDWHIGFEDDIEIIGNIYENPELC
jgi:uncharacterized phage protein (TIGR01671 family)